MDMVEELRMDMEDELLRSLGGATIEEAHFGDAGGMDDAPCALFLRLVDGRVIEVFPAGKAEADVAVRLSSVRDQ